MAYTPLNLTVFEAAFAAVLAGIATSDRNISSTVAANYTNQNDVALAFAESFDTAWAGAASDTFQVFAIKHAVYGSFATRGPQHTAAAQLPATYTPLSNAIIALITQGETEAAALGITFDPWPGTGSNSVKALVRTRWIDGDTATTALNATGSSGAPYKSVGAALTAIGPNASAADANQMITMLLSPATIAAYTENPAFIPFRNQELSTPSNGNAQLVVVTGNATWANSVAGGGVHPGSFASLTVSVPITGTHTITDDGSVASLFILKPQIDAQTMCGDIIATGATALAEIILDNGAGCRDILSTANGTGAEVFLFGGGQVRNITANRVLATEAKLIGTAYTFAAGSSNSFTRCTFAFAPVITAGAGSTVTMDQPSYDSFIAALGLESLVSGTLLVQSAAGTSIPNFLRGAFSLAAGSVTNMVPGGQNNFEADMTGAAVVINLNATPVQNELVRVKNAGVGGTPVQINATGGLQIELFQNPGVLSAGNGQSVFQGPGACVTYQFDGGSWRAISQF